MIAATPLVQDPRPTLIGERVNSQGSRKAKEMLLADDYDGLLVVAEDQVAGGAHVLDVCVALTERQDEGEQMRQVVKRISLTQPAPIQIDSTEPDVIETALQQIPGRAIVNSINLEAGRDKLDRVVPLAKAHGAAVIALTIDEVGMAKTAERKLEVAQRLTQLCCDEHGLDREALIFDCLTFTLTTGDPEWRPSAVATIEGIRRDQGRRSPASRPRWASATSPSASACPRARCSTACSCTTASRPGSTWRWSIPTTSPRTPRSPSVERELADDLVFDRREDALERFIAHFESKGPDEGAPARRRQPDRGHGARGGPALPHPAPQEGGRRGLDRRAATRRSAPSRRSTPCCCRR